MGSLARFYAGLVGERAREGHWRGVPLLPVWGRTNDRGLWVALQPTLIAHLPRAFPALDGMSQTMLTQRCKAAGLSPADNRITVDGGRAFTATIILPERVAEMNLPDIAEHEDPFRTAPRTRSRRFGTTPPSRRLASSRGSSTDALCVQKAAGETCILAEEISPSLHPLLGKTCILADAARLSASMHARV